MKYQFPSKVYIGCRRSLSFIRGLVIIVSSVMMLCILFKILMGDFEITEVSALVTVLLIISVAWNNRHKEHEYSFTEGEMSFETDKVRITYANVNGGKRLGIFSEENEICYDDIEVMEYSRELECFRIVSKVIRTRFFLTPLKTKVLEDGEFEVETFVYVLDEAMAKDIKMKLQRSTNQFIRVMEEE